MKPAKLPILAFAGLLGVAMTTPAAAARAQSVASTFKGVQSVNNHLTWHTSAR